VAHEVRRRTVLTGLAGFAAGAVAGGLGYLRWGRPAPPLTELDLLVPYVAFGGRPPGHDHHLVRLHRRRHLIRATPARGAGVALTLAVPGVTLSADDDLPMAAVPSGWEEYAGGIQGRPATWRTVTGPNSEFAHLDVRWTTGAGASAMLRVGGTSVGEAEATLRTVAPRIRFAATQRLRLPVRVPEVPSPLHLATVTLGETPGDWTAVLGFDTAPSVDDLVLLVAVSAKPTPMLSIDGPGNTTVDGRRAYRTVSETAEDLQVAVDGGTYVRIEARGRTAVEALGADGAVGLFRTLRLARSRDAWV
jgi:hypothetical protein